jgi:hypothetical protein
MGIGGTMGKGRERQIILKKKFQQKSSAWDENRTFLEGDVLEVEYALAARMLTHVFGRAAPGTASSPALFSDRGVTV